jgi:DNA invertase Pin-like site-specific DNA recombinase
LNANDHANGDGELTPAVLYLRMSSDDQEGSIEQQRKEVLAFAEGKYHVVREYVDAGKSGSKDQEKRVAFRRMLLDSARGDFQAVLVWKTSRFARLDSLDASEAKRTLRGNGVCLVSIKEGVIDWNTMTGRIMDALHAELDHAYSASLASDSLRGRLDRLAAGFWPNGSVPYGYHRLYVSRDGQEILMRRTQAFRKPDRWDLRLVVCEEEAAVVRWLFDQITAADRPLRALAQELNARRVPPPAVLGKRQGPGWSPQRVRAILTNPAYVGVGYLGSGRNRHRGKFDLADNVRQAGCCPVLVDPETFERAQAVLAGRGPGRRKPRDGTGALAGVLRCGCCGYGLSTGRENGRLYYYCKSPGNRPGLTGCKKWRVYEDEILPRVCRKLVEVVDGELLQALEARPPVGDRLGDLEMARQQLLRLEKAVEEAAGRYLRAPATLLPQIEASLLAMREELAERTREYRRLAATADESAVSNFTRWWRSVRGSLLLLPTDAGAADADGARVFWDAIRDTAEPAWDALEGPPPADADARYVYAEPAALRGLLCRLGVKATCSWGKAKSIRKKTPGRGRGPSYVLTRMVLTVEGESAPLTSAAAPDANAPDGQSCPGPQSPHDRRPSSPGRRSSRSSGNSGRIEGHTSMKGGSGSRTPPGARSPTPLPCESPSGTTPASTARCGTPRRR